jgi:hypothetical protein
MIDSMYIDSLQIHGDGANYALTNIGAGMLGMPVVRDNRPERPQRHGLIELSQFYSGRVIELQGIVIGSSISDAYDKLDALKLALQIGQGISSDYESVGVSTGAPVHTLKFTRVGDAFQQYTRFTVDGEMDVSMDIASRIIPWGVTLKCPDPRFYKIHTADNMGDYAFVNILHGTNETFTVGGNTDALPWFTLEGPYTGPATITFTTPSPDQTDKVTGDLADANNIDVVTRTRLCVHNQTIAPERIDRANTDWFTLPPGSCNIAFAIGGGGDSGTICIVRWQDARF